MLEPVNVMVNGYGRGGNGDMKLEVDSSPFVKNIQIPESLCSMVSVTNLTELTHRWSCPNGG